MHARAWLILLAVIGLALAQPTCSDPATNTTYGVCFSLGSGTEEPFVCPNVKDREGNTHTNSQWYKQTFLGDFALSCDDLNPCTEDFFDEDKGKCMCRAVQDGFYGECAGPDMSADNAACTEKRCIRGVCKTITVEGITPMCSASVTYDSPCKMNMCKRGVCTGPMIVGVNDPQRACCGNGELEGDEKDWCCADLQATGTGLPEGKECIGGIVVTKSYLERDLQPFIRAFPSWGPVVVLALLIGYFLAALGYMAASFFRMPELEAWAKNELAEVSASAFFAANAIFFIGLIDAAAVELMGKDYFTMAANFLNLLSGETTAIMAELMRAQFILGFSSMLGVQFGMQIPVVIGFIVPGIAAYPLVGAGVITTALATYGNAATMSLMSALGMAVLLEFINRYALTVMLPAGIVLRCFTLTRRLGATLMAIAVGLYVFYPLSLAWNGMIYGNVERPNAGGVSFMSIINNIVDPTPFLEIFGGPPFRRFCVHWYDWVWCWWYAIIWWIINMVIAFIQLTIALAMLYLVGLATTPIGGIGVIAYDYFVGLIPSMMRTMAGAFLFPLIDLIIVVTAIRSISPAIGGETRITGLVEFI